jgi:predicted acyl esterase
MLQIDDGARVVEYLGRDAPWSNGSVGMYGVSYDAETQLSVAALGDPARTRWLKAIIPIASVGGQYEYSYLVGVPFAGQAPLSMATYLAVSALPSQSLTTHDPTHAPEKATCQPEMFVNAVDMSGDLTPFWKEREYRRGASSIRAATLLVHGLADFNVKPLTAAGLLERIPQTTPHKGLFGIWEHATPDDHQVASQWERVDWMPMATAWFDRFLKGFDTGVEEWPEVQVQGTDGRWRAEPDWPLTGGPVGHLALGADGALGVPSPRGSTSYLELTPKTGRRQADIDGTYAVFETRSLRDRLEITGQPVLDLWVTLAAPDAHIAAMLETFDGSGQPIEAGENYGFRSARHLVPLVQNRFAQEQGEAPPVGVPIRVPVRFYPTDLVVPTGGTVRLTIAGAIPFSGLTSAPSGTGATVTIHHDCEHPSALRFLTPRDRPDLLNVRERLESMRSLRRARIVTAPIVDAGGLARAAVCGAAPIHLASLGRAPTGAAPPADVLGRTDRRTDLPATGLPATVWLGTGLIASAAALASLVPSGRRTQPRARSRARSRSGGSGSRRSSRTPVTGCANDSAAACKKGRSSSSASASRRSFP